MTELAPALRSAPSKHAIAASALAVAVASGAIGVGGLSGIRGLKQQTQALLSAAAAKSRALLQPGNRTVKLPRGSLAAVVPAEPFVLKAANTREHERAERCLANAVYYEAAREPEEGQRAVAQVVLNRVRDPNFPKSICGVVYQGWERQTGCQFSFTCDGSLVRGAPDPALMANARRVAAEALNGHVEAQVGTATHYHADYVSPWWRTSVTRVAQIGAHIFYRWPGAAGALANFTGQYRGGETRLSDAVLSGRAARPVQAPSAADPTFTALKRFVVADASAPGGVRSRIHATLMFAAAASPLPVAAPAPAPLTAATVPMVGGRPRPTPEQIAQMEAVLDKKFPGTRPTISGGAVPAAAVAAAQPAPAKLEAVSTAPQPAAASAEPVVAGD